MKYLSLFSGIEAASLAWEPLGWEPMAFCEIEPFPSAVLAHRWPDVPNLGDILAVDWERWFAENGTPDVIVAGSPCQAFSVAGTRRSLEDARGNLSLFTAELVRLARPRYFVYENVPGILSTRDNAFGCFLGELVGAGEPLVSPGKRWADAGLVAGPEARGCWRVLDAQYFGLAQRRRRVFLVLCPRDGDDPAEVLLEPACLFGNPAPSREARTRSAGDAPRRPGARGLLADTGVVRGLKSRFSTSGADLDDAEAGHLVAGPQWWDGSPTTECLDSFKPSHYTRGKDGAPSEVCPPLTKEADKGDQDPIIFEARHYTRGQGGPPGDLAPCLKTHKTGGPGDAEPLLLAFSCKDDGRDATEDASPPLRAMGHEGSHPNAGGQVAVAFQLNGDRDNPGVSVSEDTAFCIPANPMSDRGQAVALAENQRGELRTSDVITNLNSSGGKPGQGYPAIVTNEGDAYKCPDCAHFECHLTEPTACPACGSAGYENVMIRPTMGPHAGEEFDFQSEPQCYRKLPQGVDLYNQAMTGEVTQTLRTPVEGGGIETMPAVIESQPPSTLALASRTRDGEKTLEWQEEVAYSLNSPGAGGRADERMVFTGDGEVADPIGANEARTYTNEGTRNFRMHNVVGSIAPTLAGGTGGGAGHQYRQKGNEDALVVAGFKTGQSVRGTFAYSEEQSPTLEGGGGGNNKPAVLAPTLTSSNDPSRSPQSSEVTAQVEAVAAATMAVRRLTPRECERLQGMPDDHTRVPWRGKPAEDCPDGPRYKAIGNSMAVNVMRWIGMRAATSAGEEQE